MISPSSDMLTSIYQIADQIYTWDRLRLISYDDDELLAFCTRLIDYYEQERGR